MGKLTCILFSKENEKSYFYPKKCFVHKNEFLIGVLAFKKCFQISKTVVLWLYVYDETCTGWYNKSYNLKVLPEITNKEKDISAKLSMHSNFKSSLALISSDR